MADNTDSGSQEQDNHVMISTIRLTTHLANFQCKKKRRKTSIGDVERFPQLKHFLNESKSDVVFLVDGQRVPAKKGVLEINSDVFDAMFSGQFKESTAKEIQITDTTADAFETMVLFMYTQHLFLTDAQDLQLIDDVLHCADYYQVIRLVDAIGKHLESMVSVETMEAIADIAAKYGIRWLTKSVGVRLAPLLTPENVLSVATVVFTHDGNTDEFVSALKTFMDKNFQRIAAKECQYLIELNTITNNLWLQVVDAVAKGRSPSGHQIKYTSIGDSRQTTPMIVRHIPSATLFP